MTTKLEHTPGPWDLDFDSFESGIGVVIPNSKTVITEVWPQGDHPPFTYREMRKDRIASANARLIAAAPELLELLQDVYEIAFVDQEHSPLANRIEKIFQKIRGEA